MTRRGFLGSLAVAASAFALDPERALWVPGAKTISIPRPASVRLTRGPEFKIGDTIMIRRPVRFIVSDGQALSGRPTAEFDRCTVTSVNSYA